MKKVLVTGAAGNIGNYVIKYLLSEGKYEITALDLNNKKSRKKLKRYKRRINVLYGDINDQVLMENLVRDHDYIIHLAGVMPPLGELSKKSGEIIDYLGTENIIKAINYYNKNCFLVYASTTSIYGDVDTASIKNKIDEKDLTNYSLNKYKTENLIKKKLNNYTIFRIPIVLNNITKEPFIYNINKDMIVEVTTNYDVAYAFANSIKYKKELNKRVFNVGMGENGRIKYNVLLNKILKNYGISFRYILSRIFLEKNYYSPILTDSSELENIIHYQNDTLYNYYKRISNKGKKRKIQKILAKPILWLKSKE